MFLNWKNLTKLLWLTNIFLLVSCSEIFRTELPPIIDCLDENEVCSYRETIQPILNSHCTRCHGDLGRKDAGLDLSSYSSTMEDGPNNQIVSIGNHESSMLWIRVVDEINPMPPVYDAEMIHEDYANMIKKWINNGAPDN
mgnify:FL=1